MKSFFSKPHLTPGLGCEQKNKKFSKIVQKNLYSLSRLFKVPSEIGPHLTKKCSESTPRPWTRGRVYQPTKYIDTKIMLNFGDIFEWDSWEEEDSSFDIYYTCELLKDVGDFEAGHEFYNVKFDKENLTLYFYEDEDDAEPALVRVLTCN